MINPFFTPSRHDARKQARDKLARFPTHTTYTKIIYLKQKSSHDRDMNVDNKAKSLAKYISTLSDFSYVEPDIPYNHMGATISDAILQSGLNYKTVVKPRIDEILEKYPDAKTTSAFLRILNEIGPNKLLRWQDSEKPNRVLELVNLFIAEGIENEKQLKIWLKDKKHIALLEKVRGVGNKTIDYIKLLSGNRSTSAIDRHLLGFISEAGISVNGYSEAKDVINGAADLIGKDKSLLDHSIWKYMSEKKGKRVPCKKRARSIINAKAF